MTNDHEACDRVLVALRRIMRAVDQHSKQLEQRCGLTGPQILLLREIRKADELSIGALARHANLSQATVTAIVDRLQRRGLVERLRSEQDKRKVFVRVSAAGKAQLRQAPPLLQDQFVDRFQLLMGWEQLQILSTVERLAGLMSAEEIDASPVLSSGVLVDETPSPERAAGSR
ncbi:MAG: MarR family transcriptional regulator [Gammaproteobacteria bacterium]|nr:MarR family transcriptional regulator [Gammaproteobacteria bacterium]